MKDRGLAIRRIDTRIHDLLLADALWHSIDAGLQNPCVHLMGGTVWEVFEHSLKAAVRDIQNHPRGELFRRLLYYGPPEPDAPLKSTSEDKTILSDPECVQCVEFIFSHMVNRFKGELAELLSIGPCLELMERLQAERALSDGTELYMGDTIQERRRLGADGGAHWGDFTKGADGLLVERKVTEGAEQMLRIGGIIEIKSMPRSQSRLGRQIGHHLRRLAGGLKLIDQTWDKNQLDRRSPAYVMVIPSSWRLSRDCYYRNGKLIFPVVDRPPAPTRFQPVGRNQWQITLEWSKEAIERAAYEMTYWYMSQVGMSIYRQGPGGKPLPKAWEGMSPQAAGYNAIKMMLYYLILRYLTPQQGRRAIKLYNAYSFGYPLAADAKDMLWPEDIRHMNTRN